VGEIQFDTEAEIDITRARDFWGALVLIALSVFFLTKTFEIPLWGENRAGVSGGDWYNSAAIVPLFIFGSMLVLSIVLLITAIRAGGGARAFSQIGLGWNRAEALRFATIGAMLLAYIGGLVPRVDFILCSGLLITALIYGFYGGHMLRAVTAATVMVVAGLFAFLVFPAQENWAAKGDDWVTLALFVGLTILVLRAAQETRVLRFVPLIAVIAPVILVCAMAFGFRQNVPARGGLLFAQIEYHYYVTLRPLWKD